MMIIDLVPVIFVSLSYVFEGYGLISISRVRDR